MHGRGSGNGNRVVLGNRGAKFEVQTAPLPSGRNALRTCFWLNEPNRKIEKPIDHLNGLYAELG